MRALLLILTSFLFTGGCVHRSPRRMEAETKRQIVGRWMLQTGEVMIDFRADGTYVMSNSGPKLIAHIDKIPNKLRSLHLMLNEGAWSVAVIKARPWNDPVMVLPSVGTRLLIVPCFPANSESSMSSTILHLDQTTFEFQHSDHRPVRFIRLSQNDI